VSWINFKIVLEFVARRPAAQCMAVELLVAAWQNNLKLRFVSPVLRNHLQSILKTRSIRDLVIFDNDGSLLLIVAIGESLESCS
jgi:hypothetical protein